MDNIDNLETFFTEEIMTEHLTKGFSVWGIEGTEDKIRELYASSPVILEKYLGVYNKLLKGA